jgi:hypothetical protein
VFLETVRQAAHQDKESLGVGVEQMAGDQNEDHQQSLPAPVADAGSADWNAE